VSCVQTVDRLHASNVLLDFTGRPPSRLVSDFVAYRTAATVAEANLSTGAAGLYRDRTWTLPGSRARKSRRINIVAILSTGLYRVH
jgi:hypothetical protein